MKLLLSIILAFAGSVCADPQQIPDLLSPLLNVTEATSASTTNSGRNLANLDPKFAFDPRLQITTNQQGKLVVGYNRGATNLSSRASQGFIEIHETGASARNPRWEVHFTGNLRDSDAIKIVLPHGNVLQGRVIALSISDGKGQRIWLADLQDSEGEVVSDNQVLFRNAFRGTRADVLFSYSAFPGQFEQDIILRERLILPPGIDEATARFEIWSAFFRPPHPEKRIRQVVLRQGRPGQKDVLDRDENLDFGQMGFISGSAFFLDNGQDRAVARRSGIPVVKSWIRDGDYGYLLESTDYVALKPLLEKLNPAAANANRATSVTNLTFLADATKAMGEGTSGSRRSVMTRRQLRTNLAAISIAEPGVVLDYLLSATTLLNVNLGDQAYLGPAAIAKTTNDYWNTFETDLSIGTLTNLLWSDSSSSGGELVLENGAGHWHNETGNSLIDEYTYAPAGNVIATFNGIPAGSYDVYVYGAWGGVARVNGNYVLTSAGQDYGQRQTTLSADWSSLEWTEGEHYIVYRNVAVTNGQPVTLTAMPGADVALLNGLQIVSSGSVNTPPALSDVPNQTTTPGTPRGPIEFLVDDPETAASSLTVTGESDNQTLLPDANITLGGSGSERTITLTPVTNQVGTAIVTVTVSDGAAQASDMFELVVSPGLGTNQPLVTTVNSLGNARNDHDGWIGFEFQIGALPIAVSELGRWVISGNSGSHTVKLVHSDGTDVANGAVTISTSGQTAGQFAYASLATPIILSANTTYALLSREYYGGDTWRDYFGTTITLGAVAGSASSAWSNPTGSYNKEGNGSGRSHGPLNLIYGDPQPPDPPSAPTNILAHAISAGQVTLTWRQTGNFAAAIYVDRKEDGDFETIAILEPAVWSWIDSGLTSETEYTYRLRAWNEGGFSDYSDEAEVTTLEEFSSIPLARLELWLAADTEANRESETALDQWHDKSGRGNDGVQENAANQPSWVDNVINGRPIIRFDGTNDYMSFENFLAGVGDAEVFVVLKAAQDVPSNARGLWAFSSPDAYLFYPSTDGTITDDFGSSSLRNIGNPSQPLNQAHVYNVASSPGEWTARINGQVQYSTANNTCVFGTSPRLGSSAWGSYPFAGDMAEVMIFNRVLSGEEREAVGRYLNLKYDMVTTVPTTPTNLVAGVVSGSQINLAWSSALSSAGVKYTIERKTGTGGTYDAIAEVADATGFLDSNLTPATTYFYRVMARNLAGSSDFSNEASGTTSTSGLGVPLSSLQLWLKAEAGVVRQGTNNTVYGWYDQSGSQTAGNQSTTNYQPLWIENSINGHPALRFDGTNDNLEFSNLVNGLTETEVFVALKANEDTPAASRGLWAFGNSGGYVFYPGSGGDIADDFGSTVLRSMGNPVQLLDRPHVYNVAVRPGEWTSRINGQVLFSGGNDSLYSRPNPALGGWGGSYYFGGDIAEVMVFDRVLSSDERDAVGVYLNTKYSLFQTSTPVPAALQATAVSPGQLRLSWTNTFVTNTLLFSLERKTGAEPAYSHIGSARDNDAYLDASAIPGAVHSYRVKAWSFNGESSYSGEISVPSVTLTATRPLLSFSSDVNLAASASDADGSVSKVEFLVNGTVAATKTSPPYSVTLTNLPTGFSAIIACATDDEGNSSFSTLSYVVGPDDTDGDGISDFDELLWGTDPYDPDSPGFDPGDSTPPVITLVYPANAVLLP